MNKPFIPSLKSFLAVVCCLLLSAGVYAQRFTYTYHSVEFKCKIKSGETVCITGFDQKAETVRVPGTVEYAGREYPVKEIDTYISGNNYSTVSLTIEEGIEEIANYSFVEFRDLKEVHLPETVKKIGKNTFADIANIPQFHASQEICQELKITEKVQLAEEKEKKKSREFETTYKSQKFQCVLSSGVVTIIDFDTKAINVTIPSEVEYNGVVYPVRKIGLYRPQKYHAQKLIIEEGIEEITNYSFSRFKELQEVHLPQSLIKIGKKTFDDVDKIPQFYASAKICKELGVDYQPLLAETTVTTQPIIQQTLMVSTSSNKEEKKGKKKEKIQEFETTYKSQEFKCLLISGIVSIVDFDTKASSITIPSEVEYNGIIYPVKKILLYNFKRYHTQKLIIEEGVEEFRSLKHFKDLQEVHLPHSLKMIGKNTFDDVEKIPQFYASAEICKELGIESRPLLAGTPTLQPQKPSKQPSPMFLMSGDGDVSVTPREEQNAVQQEAPEIHGPTISDVDTDIPQNKQENEYSFAIIIANETYDVETPVEFALHDGKIFKEYCTSLLGIPEENIRLLENASHMQIRRTVEWLKKVAQAYSGVCRIYFYYAGHGMPDEEKRCAYILPTDGYASDVAISGYSLKELYDTLGRLPAQSVTVFLDACFSGMKRNGAAIVAARGVSIRPEEETLSGNVVVFSATSEAETAYSYRNKGHGLFTYYLLKKLKQSRGNVSYEELSRYVQTEVMRKSLTLNDKSQTPTVTVSPSMESKWKKINFNIQH